MSTRLALAALLFGLLAAGSGAAQLVAYGSTGWLRHLVVGLFAVAVGVSVLVAVIGAMWRRRR